MSSKELYTCINHTDNSISDDRIVSSCLKWILEECFAVAL